MNLTEISNFQSPYLNDVKCPPGKIKILNTCKEPVTSDYDDEEFDD
jgi:hypothetical protein